MTSRRENGRISWVLPVTGLVAGLTLLAYFPLAAMGSASHQDEAVQAVDASMAHVNPEMKERLLTQAKAYNEKLAGNPIDGFTEELLPYGQQLSPDGHDTAFGYVTIPDIDLCMPMYHGADDAALSAGIGHLEGTSLPIGGTSTHAVLTAHSGLEGMRAFDDIRKLEPGGCVRRQGSGRFALLSGDRQSDGFAQRDAGARNSARGGPLHVAHLHTVWSQLSSPPGAGRAM